MKTTKTVKPVTQKEAVVAQSIKAAKQETIRINEGIVDKLTLARLKKGFELRLSNAMAIQTDSNTWQLQKDQNSILQVRFIDQKILLVGNGVKKFLNMAEKADLSAMLDIINNSYYNVISRGEVPQIEQQPISTTTKTKEANTMTTKTSVNTVKFQASLKKNGWTENKGVFEKGGVSILFNAKQAILGNGDNTQKITLATCTDATLANCIKGMLSGAPVEWKAEKGLTSPAIAAPTTPVLENSEPLPEREQSPSKQSLENAVPAKKTATKKTADTKAVPTDLAVAPPAPPKKPVNPHGDKHPTFDLLSVAVSVLDKAEETIKSTWQPIAEKYSFSVSGLINDLHAEGVWADKIDKNGKPFEVDGFTVPTGYKGLYESEKEQGIQGPGHMVNRAARMFSKLNPNAFKRDPSKPEADTKEAKEQKQSEKTVDQILTELSRLAAKLSPEDLLSWLNTDKSVLACQDKVEDIDDDLLSNL